MGGGARWRGQSQTSSECFIPPREVVGAGNGRLDVVAAHSALSGDRLAFHVRRWNVHVVGTTALDS